MSEELATPESKEDFTRWDYGHLIRQCYKCGHKTIMDKDVEGGVSLYLPTTDKHELRLVCEQCGNAIAMFFVKSDKVKPPTEPDEKPNVADYVVEEKKVKRKRRKKKDETPKDSKEEESVSANSEGS
jgi:ribosomal protein S27AE